MIFRNTPKSNLTATESGKRRLAAALLLALAPNAHAVNGVDPQENVILQWNDAALEAIRDNEVVRAICPSPLWGKMADAMIKARGETK